MTERIPVVPDPLMSDRQFARFCHWDIANLEETQLTDELHALRPLLWGLPADDWLRERVAELEAELAERERPHQTPHGHESANSPEPKLKPKLLARGVKP